VQRQRYPQSAAEGRSVFESPGDGTAAAEIGALADELAERFLRDKRRHVA
jgi:hypothetical protein